MIFYKQSELESQSKTYCALKTNSVMVLLWNMIGHKEYI